MVLFKTVRRLTCRRPTCTLFRLAAAARFVAVVDRKLAARPRGDSVFGCDKADLPHYRQDGLDRFFGLAHRHCYVSWRNIEGALAIVHVARAFDEMVENDDRHGDGSFCDNSDLGELGISHLPDPMTDPLPWHSYRVIGGRVAFNLLSVSAMAASALECKGTRTRNFAARGRYALRRREEGRTPSWRP